MPQSVGRCRPAMLTLVAAVALLAGASACTSHQPGASSGPRGVSEVTASPPLTWTAARAAPPPGTNLVPDNTEGYTWLTGVACPAAGSCVATGFTLGFSGSGVIETLSGSTWKASTAGGAAVTQLTAVACAARASCVAVGFNGYNADDGLPVAVTLSAGRWVEANVPLPPDAGVGGHAYLFNIRCPAPGTCVAVGYYHDRDGDSRALIETLSGGEWAAAQAPLPAGAVTAAGSGGETELSDVACPAAGSCVAAGRYRLASGDTAPFAETLSGGTWAPARAPLPAGAPSSGDFIGFSGISCWAPGSCLAVGHYAVGGQGRFLTDTLSGGAWTAAAAPLPVGAPAKQDTTSLTSVACQAAGSCVAVGVYVSDSGGVAGAIDTLSGRTWTAARAPVPPGTLTTKGLLGPFDVYFSSIACPAPGNCVAVGYYIGQNDNSYWPLVETGVAKHR